MKNFYFTFVFILLTISVFCQYNRRDANRIGIIFGFNQFSLHSNNFISKPSSGLNAGLSLRGNYFDDWDIVYSIQFSENNFSVATKNLASVTKDAKYKLASAQISYQLSFRLIEHHLTFEFGPLVQVNGKLTLDNLSEKNTIIGTKLLAKDIVDISRFNFYPMVGVTAGVKHFRANISYQYCLSNMLGNLNNQNLGVNFKGYPGILNGNIIIYL